MSTCSESVENVSTKSIPVSCIINNLQKLQLAKLSHSIQCEALRLELLPTRSEKSWALKSTNVLPKQLRYMNQMKTVVHRVARRVITKKIATFEKRSHHYHTKFFSRKTIRPESHFSDRLSQANDYSGSQRTANILQKDGYHSTNGQERLHIALKWGYRRYWQDRTVLVYRNQLVANVSPTQKVRNKSFVKNSDRTFCLE